MQKLTVFVIVMVIVAGAMAQPSTPGRISIIVMNGKQAPLSLASVQLLRGKDSSIITSRITNAAGLAVFENMPPGNYLCRITMVDHVAQYTGLLQISIQQPESQAPAVVLQPVDAMLKAVTVAGRQLAEHLKDLGTLHNVNTHTLYEEATAGAFIQCTDIAFFIAIGLGKQLIDGQTILFLSPQAPLAKVLQHKKAGERVLLGSTAVTIIEIY